MIIFGSAGKEIARGKTRAICTNCQQQNSINMYIVQRYIHIYWIPFCPALYKEAISECTDCNQVLKKKQFPESYKSHYKDLNHSSKIPIWMFTGLGIIAVIIFGIFINIKQNDSENAELVLLPQKDDIYEIKLSDEKYTLYKVDKIEGNAVYMLENEYITNKEDDIDQLLLKPFYKESYPIMKSDLKIMLEKGEIIDIER
jgi:hypothetical protein